MAKSISQLVLIFLVADITAVHGYKDEDVRFFQNDGTSLNPAYEGVVQMYKDGKWGGICYNGVDDDDLTATLICKALGYQFATRRVNARDAFPEHDNEEVAVDRIDCLGVDALGDCNKNWHNIYSTCSARDVLALACSSRTDYAVRLMGGTTWYEGRVEVYNKRDSKWGTICNDFWGKNDAKVVCRQLGYGDPQEATVTDGDKYKPGSLFLDVLLDNVQCRGSEASLATCDSNGWYNENCFFNEELAAVVCETAHKTGILTIGAIVGIVIGSVTVFCFLVVLLCLCYRQGQNKKRNNRPAAIGNAGVGGVTYVNQGTMGQGGVTFITPGQGQQPQQVPYGMPGAAPSYNPPPYSPPGAAYGGDENKQDTAYPGVTGT